jgi:hypothetical protein
MCHQHIVLLGNAQYLYLELGVGKAPVDKLCLLYIANDLLPRQIIVGRVDPPYYTSLALKIFSRHTIEQY